MGAIVKVSRENLALAVLWGAIGACALMILLAPKMTATGAEGSRPEQDHGLPCAHGLLKCGILRSWSRLIQDGRESVPHSEGEAHTNEDPRFSSLATSFRDRFQALGLPQGRTPWSSWPRCRKRRRMRRTTRRRSPLSSPRCGTSREELQADGWRVDYVKLDDPA